MVISVTKMCLSVAVLAEQLVTHQILDLSRHVNWNMIDNITMQPRLSTDDHSVAYSFNSKSLLFLPLSVPLCLFLSLKPSEEMRLII